MCQQEPDKAAIKKMKLLSRGDEWRRVKPDMWANFLLLAIRNGWNPDVPSISFLASHFDVSDANAVGLAEAWDHFKSCTVHLIKAWAGTSLGPPNQLGYRISKYMAD